jgi:hypothetical protein
VSVQSAGPGVSRAPAAYEHDRGGGWMNFAGTMLLILGTLNVIEGIAAVSNSKFFVGEQKYIFSDLNTWGWIAIIFGVCQLLISFGVFARSTGAAIVGVGFASLNAVAQLLAIPSYPLLSLALFSLDVLVIFGLIVYAGRTTRPT